MHIRLDSVITVENPAPSLVRWCEENLIMANPQYFKLVRMGKKAWGIEKNIVFYMWYQGKLVLPRGLLKTLYDMFPDLGLYDNRMNKCRPVTYRSAIRLRSYQQPSIQAVRSGKQGIIVMPCGAGKTETALQIIAELGQPALWITHTTDLLNQSLGRAEEKLCLSGEQIGVIGGGEYRVGTHITFSTVQSLRNKDLDSLAGRFGTVIVDECHRAFMSAGKFSMFQDVIGRIPALYRVGITASEHRSDGLLCGMYYLLGRKLYEVSQEQLNECGNVVAPSIISIPTGYRYEKDRTLEFTAVITDMAGNERRNRLIYEELLRHKGECCLVLSSRLSQLSFLFQQMGGQAAGCEYIHGKISRKNREEAVQRIRDGRSDILFASYSLAKEGLDIPRMEAEFLLTPYRDPVVVQQSVGRVMRPFEGKGHAAVYDFVDEEIPLCMSQFESRKRIYRKLGGKIETDVPRYQLKRKGSVPL